MCQQHSASVLNWTEFSFLLTQKFMSDCVFLRNDTEILFHGSLQECLLSHAFQELLQGFQENGCLHQNMTDSQGVSLALMREMQPEVGSADRFSSGGPGCLSVIRIQCFFSFLFLSWLHSSGLCWGFGLSFGYSIFGLGLRGQTKKGWLHLIAGISGILILM